MSNYDHEQDLFRSDAGEIYAYEKCEHSRIDRYRIEARQVRGRDGEQLADAIPRQSEAEERASSRKQQGFYQHLTYKAAPTPAERSAHGKLALARGPSHQQEIRHICARDEQEKDHRAGQSEDGGSDLFY